MKAIAAIHSLTLGMKIKEKIDLNEKYPVIRFHHYLLFLLISFYVSLQFLFQVTKATDSYQQLVEQGFPQLLKFLEKVSGYKRELSALMQIRPKTKSIIETLLQPLEPMGLITHTDFWCNNLLFKKHVGKDDKQTTDVSCIILDWQMITYSRWDPVL